MEVNSNSLDMRVNHWDTLEEQKKIEETFEVMRLFAQFKSSIKFAAVSPDGNYIVASLMIPEDLSPRLFLWEIDSVLESKDKENKPDKKTKDFTIGAEENATLLDSKIKVGKAGPIPNANWIICVDCFITPEYWIICGGGILGDLFVFYGKVDRKTKKWNLTNYKCEIFLNTAFKTQLVHLLSIKIVPVLINGNELHVYTGTFNPDKNQTHQFIYDWNLRIQKNEKNNLSISLTNCEPLSGEKQHTNGISHLEFCTNYNCLYSGSWNGEIIKWAVQEKQNQFIGRHKGAITGLRILETGDKLITAGLDKMIYIWDYKNLSKEPAQKIRGEISPILAMDTQKSQKIERILITASQDNDIRIWDIQHFSCTKVFHVGTTDTIAIRNPTKKPVQKVQRTELAELGQNYITQILITFQNRIVFIIKKNRIYLFFKYDIIMDNFIRHFYEQLKFIEKKDPEFYRQIYGENLKQLALESTKPEDQLIVEIYKLVLNRLRQASGETSSDYLYHRLGTIFISNFLKLEREDNVRNASSKQDKLKLMKSNFEHRKNQREYISSVKTNYDNYWHSLKSMYIDKLTRNWGFHLYVSTEINKDIMESPWVEITENPVKEKQESIDEPILMKDRKQTSLRFLLVLEEVSMTFLPLLKGIILDLEDNHGDTASINFTDFFCAENFLKSDKHHKKKTDQKSDSDLGKKKPGKIYGNIYYSCATFKLDTGYSTEDELNIVVHNITPIFTESLNPLESDLSSEQDRNIFEDFRNRFLYPDVPKFPIQIGKGALSRLGKMADTYLSKIVAISLFFILIDLIDVLILPATLTDWVKILLGIVGVGILGGILLLSIYKKWKK